MAIQDQQAIMATLMPKNQIDIVKDLIDAFFEVIPRAFETRERDDRDAFFFYLSPNKFASEELLGKFKALLDKPGITKSLVNKTKDQIEMLEKALQGRKVYLDTIQKDPKFKANL